MISLTIVATLSAVGIILSIGLLIAPGAIAFLLTNRFEKMLIIAVIITIISGFLGIYLSFFIDSAPAPTIILILTSFFIVAFIRQSLIARQISNQIKYQKER
jgi:manganese/iron transport system permease protein